VVSPANCKTVWRSKIQWVNIPFRGIKDTHTRYKRRTNTEYALAFTGTVSVSVSAKCHGNRTTEWMSEGRGKRGDPRLLFLFLHVFTHIPVHRMTASISPLYFGSISSSLAVVSRPPSSRNALNTLHQPRNHQIIFPLCRLIRILSFHTTRYCHWSCPSHLKAVQCSCKSSAFSLTTTPDNSSCASFSSHRHKTPFPPFWEMGHKFTHSKQHWLLTLLLIVSSSVPTRRGRGVKPVKITKARRSERGPRVRLCSAYFCRSLSVDCTN
jgi:hypothetical protein